MPTRGRNDAPKWAPARLDATRIGALSPALPLVPAPCACA
ncbi:Uncharacterised protein [Burkholderia pseudomallei]|nr:Uncharacterised protein [Burkholderia pseudomallei]CAJ3277115.1 Uncharacterised protein [Burkholderia pseudomallei]CAJ3298181.1 Uncharacterised protein [Burkholderia pseudomallei]CAJ3299694.1 Uncharacterised protein [Burkholderia pseudomallei]CAJ3314008.1 Uncharacterised protein [Burkholderia pseudomallei]